ncbi:MAG: TetR family transcriptional regulator [Spirochaetes bacterium]|jgi:AcrR family transcriptional regulator|nr:TetR family transcriptional regulator [Spirochaetota bacterium]
MPRRTVEESLKTRESILSAAIDAAASSGFDALSLEAVAERSEVTRGAVYHHFERRVGLVREATVRLLEQMGNRIVAAAASRHDPWDALEAGCLEFLRSAASQEYQQIVLSDAPALLGITTWQELDSRYTTSTLTEALDELDREGLLQTASTSAAAQSLSGAMNQLALWVGSGNDAKAAESVLLQLLGSLHR